MTTPALYPPGRVAALLALAFTLLLALPQVASAGSLTFENNAWVLRADSGEDSLRVEASDENDGYVQLAVDSLTSAPGNCVPAQWATNAFDCPIAGSAGVKVIAGDGDDHVNVYGGLPSTYLVDVQGGEGVDDLSAFSHGGTTRMDGGAGEDELTGGDRSDALSGGTGEDKLLGGGGNDALRGGDDADTLRGDDNGAPGADVIDGGSGRDSVDGDWSRGPSNQPHISVSLNGRADDGRPGEGDNVAGVERIHLTYAATLAAAGDPVDFEVFNSGNGGSRFAGSPGADRLRTYDDHDTVNAGAGDDWIETGYGHDTIDPGPGRDTVNAEAGTGSCNFLVCRSGSGNDTINARDGEADTIQCGVGTDVVNADAADVVTDCETVNRPTTKPDVKPEPAKAGCKVPKVKKGTKQKTAVKRVRGAGCKAKVVKAKSRKVKKGRVIKVSPKAGRKLARGAKVKVYVSRGRR